MNKNYWKFLKFVVLIFVISISGLALYIHQESAGFDPVKEIQRLKAEKRRDDARWRKAPLSSLKIENERLMARIKELFAEHKGMVGSPMMTADLHEDPEFSKVSRNRVARHMKEMGLKCSTVKKFVVTTDSKHKEPVSPILLDRQFTVPTPDTVWVSDITYLKVGRKWHYLTVFIDLFSRIVVGWDFSESLERYSAMRALNKAILRRRPSQGLMIHSDRGIQYASGDFRAILKKHRFIQSMSRKGNCWEVLYLKLKAIIARERLQKSFHQSS